MEHNSSSIIDSILSNDIFRHTDTSPLTARYNTAAALRSGNTPPISNTPVPQVGPDISSITPDGLLINRPGSYRFTQNLEWNPAGMGAAITIQSEGVILDMGNYTLTINTPQPVNSNQYYGISIENSLGICLQNGCITGASYYGVKANKVTALEIKQVQVSTMRYTETTTANLTPCGIFIDQCNEFLVEGCTVQDISVTAPSCAGIQVLESTNGAVLQCTMSGFLNNDGGVQGYSYLMSSAILTQNCIAENFQSHYMGLTKTTGHTVIGYVPIFCNELSFTDCSASGMTGCCDDCHGMSVFLDTNVAVTNFYATAITDGVAAVNTGAKATGLEVYGINVSISNCRAENILAIRPQDLQSTGFSAWGMNISFTNCTATNVQVLDANRQPDTAYGYGTGFGWAPDPRPEFKAIGAFLVTYNHCTATDCQLGFDTWCHIDSIWENIATPGCPVPILAQPYGATRVYRMDNCSESPSSMPECVTVSNMAMGNLYPGMELKNQPNSISFPPQNVGSSWNVPRVSLPNLFAIQSLFQTEWWYYVGTVYSDAGVPFSVQVQLLRATITPSLSVSAAFTGIGCNRQGQSQYMFGQCYGLGASENGPGASLGNALVIPPVSDNNFTATFSPLIAVTGQSSDPLQDFQLTSNSQFSFSYTGNSILGCMGSTYALNGNGSGYSTTAGEVATTPMNYAFSFEVMDQRGTVMEGVSGYVGPDMFSKNSNPDAPPSYECAQPLLQVAGGTISLGDSTHTIKTGSLWMDRQMVAAAGNSYSDSPVGTPNNAADFKRLLATGSVGAKPLYRGDWMAVTLNNGISMALAEFWQPSNPQWITGTRVNLPPENGFGNLYFKIDNYSTPISNGGMHLKPRLSLTSTEDWDFDINILEPENSADSPHWQSPITQHTYASAWEIEFSPNVQQYNVPAKLYVFALCENSENVLPMQMNAYFEGAALAYADKERTQLVGHVFVEQMGFN